MMVTTRMKKSLMTRLTKVPIGVEEGDNEGVKEVKMGMITGALTK
jgi:hypothetical protein